MKVEKEKRKVNIIFEDTSLLKGFVHINPGERLIDFLNDPKENFIAVTEAEFYNVREVHSFKLISEITKKKETMILNKATIKMIEEA